MVEYAEGNANSGARNKFGANEKRVRELRKQKEELQSLPRLGEREIIKQHYNISKKSWQSGLREQVLRT